MYLHGELVLVIDAKFLQNEELEKLKREVNQALKEPWTIELNQRLHQAGIATLIKGSNKGRDHSKIKLTSNSKIGRFLRSNRAWSWLNVNLS